MAVPVIESFSQNNSANATASSLSITAASGIQAGDLLLIIGMCDDTESTTTWDALSGWTKQIEGGDADSDCDFVVYWKQAAGSDSGETISITGGTREMIGWMIRISGADTTTPFHVTGTTYTAASGTTHVLPGITTTETDTLGIYLMAFDGDDYSTFAPSGSWTEQDEEASGAGGSGVGGSWGSLNLASAQSTGDVTITVGANTDGAAGVVFALSAGASGATLTDVNLVDLTGTAQASLTSLRWSWFDSTTPSSFSAPTDQGTTESTDGSGNISLTMASSVLTTGQEGTLVLSNAGGTIIGAYRLAVD